MANDLKLDVKVTGAQKGAADINQVAAATEKTTQATGQFNRVFVDSKNATDAAAGSVNNLFQKSNDAKDVVEGLSQAARGGDGAFFGLAKSARGFFNIFKSGARLIGGAALALTAVKAAIDLWVASSEKAVEAARNFTSENERVAGSLKQIEDASKKALADQKQQVEELTEAYKTLNGQIDSAAQRVDKLNSAQTSLKLAQLDQEEAQALSTASPDQNLRDGIRRDFSRRREDVRAAGERTRLENTRLQTGVEEKAATEALAGFRQQLDDSALAVKRAEDELAGARANASVVNAETVNTDFGRALRDAVKVAEAAAQAARENQAAITAALQPQIEAANRQIQQAKDTRTLIGVQEQTLATETKTRTTTRTNEDIDLKRKQEQERQAAQIKAQTSSVESSPGLDAQPVQQAVEEQAAAVTAKFETSNAGVAATAQAIAAATTNIPPAPDFAGVSAAFAQYHQTVFAQFTTLQQRVSDLQRQIQTLSMSFKNSR